MRCWRLLHMHIWSMARDVDSPLHLHTWSAPRDVDLTFWAAPPGPQFLRKLGPDFHDAGPEIGARFPAKPLRRKSVPNLGRARGESSLLPFGCKLVRLQLGQIRVASTATHHHLLHSHRLHSRPDQVQNPKSKIQTPNGPFGFWILEFGFWSLEFGVWILDFGFWILDFGFWILDFGFWILDLGFWILDFGFWSLDFGFWILDQFSIRSFCGGPKRRRLDFGFWILEFGFWILDFGFWILDFGFWSLDFGFWILDFGFWILVWMRPYPTSFGSCIRYFHVTPTRVGGLSVKDKQLNGNLVNHLVAAQKFRTSGSPKMALQVVEIVSIKSDLLS